MNKTGKGWFKPIHGHHPGKTPSLTYRTWRGMISRCRTPKPKDAKRYKDRGIFVCDRWQKFENFLEDMGCKPEGYTLDRIDNDGPYCKENCRWACHVRQVHNSRASKLDLDKVSQIRWMWAEGFKQVDIAKKFGVCQSTISHLVNGDTWVKEEKPIIKKEEGYSHP